MIHLPLYCRRLRVPAAKLFRCGICHVYKARFMEPVSALLGAMAALPQCIQSAKELYDLRSRYKDASILITAIYSESMVIAASLSQVQILLQHDALKSKPQLLETFDRALTGCRVVYGCLEEEVRDLVVRADANELKFKDRAKFLWKEDTFKELLTQIRGQQSALSLLIQGLQMESIADIRKLVEGNSATLDQVVKRSRTLRQSHPRLRVPESLFNYENTHEELVDVESTAKSAGFSFEDEVINSRAYRRAMAQYTSSVKTKKSQLSEQDGLQDELPMYEPPHTVANDGRRASTTDPKRLKGESSEALDAQKMAGTKAVPSSDSMADNFGDAFESIEKDYLPYMPRVTSTAPYLTPLRANTSSEVIAKPGSTQIQIPIRSYSDGNILSTDEKTPPLPPRRPSGPQLMSKASITGSLKLRSEIRDESTDTSVASLVLSKASTSSSHTMNEQPQPYSVISRKPVRKPLPLVHQISHDVLGTISSKISTIGSRDTVFPLRNVEMHNIWLSLLEAERNFVDRMSKFRKMFYDNVLRSWPLLEQHLQAIVVGEQLAAINNESLLQLMESQLPNEEDSICDPSMFEDYTSRSWTPYCEYFQTMPHALSSLRTTQMMDFKFAPFVHTLGLSIAWFGMSWQDYLELPLLHLDVSIVKLESLASVAENLAEPLAIKEAGRLRRAAGAMQTLKALSITILAEARNREEIQNLEKRIHTMDSNIFSQLRLLDSDRRVEYQGNMALKVRGQGPWQAVHVMLLDNYLLWGKVKAHKKTKGDKVMVLDAPIAVKDLKVMASCEQHEFQKATMFDEISRGSVIYTISVGSKSLCSKPHLLSAFTFEEQKEWLGHLTAVDTVYAP